MFKPKYRKLLDIIDEEIKNCQMMLESIDQTYEDEKEFLEKIKKINPEMYEKNLLSAFDYWRKSREIECAKISALANIRAQI